MFEQLDLFGTPVEQSPQPPKGRGRLVPPAVVETPAEKPAPAPAEPTPEVTQQVPAEPLIAEPSVLVTDEALPEPITDAAPDEMQDSATPVVPAKSGRGRKSLQEMGREAALLEIPEDSVLFSKQYYSIGEVASMFHVNASLLRFWEAEFSILKPRKNKKGDRFFRPEDIKNLQLIHHLLRERKYTIEGAREFLRKSGRRKEQFEAIESLKKIKAFLVELKAGI
jgi:DNA-binding transcriptional MerR regulator